MRFGPRAQHGETSGYQQDELSNKSQVKERNGAEETQGVNRIHRDQVRWMPSSQS